MKKLTVKISKQTGYEYLEAARVKEHIDALEKSIKTKALEDLNTRVFELERRYDQHIRAEHIGYTPTITGSSEWCTCDESIQCHYHGCKNDPVLHCANCEKPYKLKPSQDTLSLRSRIVNIIDQMLIDVDCGTFQVGKAVDEILEVIHE